MRYLFTSLLLVVLLFPTLHAQTKASIAVLELEPIGISNNEAEVLSDRLRTELFKTNNFIVLERDKMDEILIEQGFQLSGCTTNECLVEAGKLIGVEQMIAGKIAKIDNLFTLNIRLIDVETGKVIKTATEDCECALKDVLVSSIQNVAFLLAGLKIEDKQNNIKTTSINPRNRLTYDNGIVLYQEESKSPTGAAIQSFLIPGLGHFYTGNTTPGLAYLIATPALTIGGAILAQQFSSKGDDQTDGAITGGLLAFVLIKTFDLIYAIDGAKEYNNKLRKKYKISFYPSFNEDSQNPTLSLNVNF